MNSFFRNIFAYQGKCDLSRRWVGLYIKTELTLKINKQDLWSRTKKNKSKLRPYLLFEVDVIYSRKNNDVNVKYNSKQTSERISSSVFTSYNEHCDDNNEIKVKS